MGFEITKDQTSVNLPFLLVSATDHISGVTGATVTVTISKNCAVFDTPEGTVQEVGSGWYGIAANANDADTIGGLAIHATAAGADPCDDLFVVVAAPLTAADIWSYATRSLTTFGSLVTDVSSGVWTVGTRTLTSFGTLSTSIINGVWAAGTRTLTSLGSGTITEFALAVWTSPTRTLSSYGTLVADTAAAVWASTTRTLSSYGTLVADVVSGVWNAVVSDYLTLGTMGQLIGLMPTQGTVVVAAPISPDGSLLSLIIGYDYDTYDGDSLTWTDADGVWPDLTDVSSVTFVVKDRTLGTTLFSVAGTVTGAGLVSQAVSFDVSATQTSLLTAVENRYAFYVVGSFAATGTATSDRVLTWGWVSPSEAPPAEFWGLDEW